MATPTKEEILTKHTGWLRVRTGEANLSDVIDAMQEYAELYHKEKLREQSQQIELPSDEEIKKEIKDMNLVITLLYQK